MNVASLFAGMKGEASLVSMFLVTCQREATLDERLPFLSIHDSFVKEFRLPYGRADIVIFHLDGSATVVEAKDGTNGYNHVVAGIGQVGLYAAQLAMKGQVRTVRRALLFSGTSHLEADLAIELACEQANVTPLPFGVLADQFRALQEASL